MSNNYNKNTTKTTHVTSRCWMLFCGGLCGLETGHCRDRSVVSRPANRPANVPKAVCARRALKGRYGPLDEKKKHTHTHTRRSPHRLRHNGRARCAFSLFVSLGRQGRLHVGQWGASCLEPALAKQVLETDVNLT